MTEEEESSKVSDDKKGESSSKEDASKKEELPAAAVSDSATNSSRRVTFHSSTKQQQRQRQAHVYHDGINGDDPLGVGVPRRVKFGKGGKNTALRDAFFLVAFVGMLLYFAQNAPVGPTKDNKPRKKNRIAIADEINKIQKTMTNMLMESVEESRRKEGCDIFTAKSSVPATGLGVFAGRRFLKGEIIHETTFTTPVEMENGVVEELSSLALLLKFHPWISNVEPVNGLGTAMQLRATRAIKPGEELFLPYEQHPLHTLSLENNRVLFETIPLASDYEIAELVQNEIVVEARRMEVAHQRRVQDAITLNTGYLYSLGSKITSRFAPNVAKLLPASATEVRARKGLRLPLAMLANQTLATLQLRGSCYGDAKLKKTEQDETLSVVTTRKVARGETLQAVPVHLFQSAAFKNDRCVSSKGFHACLLTDAAMIPIGSSPEEGNVALQWPDNNVMNDFLESNRVEAPAGSASLDLVAKKAMEIGEKLVLVQPTIFEKWETEPRQLAEKTDASSNEL